MKEEIFMPSYITHAIFGQELHSEYLNYDKNILIDKRYMVQYALGPDLSRFTNSHKNTHQDKTREFLMTMIWYIKENGLENNQQALGILFGHISHYFLDTNMHPLVYYNALGCEPVGLISSHTLIEGYLDEYFKKIKNLGEQRLLKDVKIFDNDTDGVIVPPEDIGKYQLTKDMVEQVAKGIEEAKEMGSEPEHMKLTYKKIDTPNNMV